MDDKQTIQNLNQMLAVATGRLDVVHKMLETAQDDHDLRKLKTYVNKAVANVDEMIERHNNGERVVK